MRYTISAQQGLLYEDAKKILKALSSADIRAHFMIGGIAIYPKNKEEFKIMQTICGAFGVVYDEGATEKEEDIIHYNK